MFSVIFEVHPKADHWDDYLGHAKMLRPELERVDGFVSNIRYRSLTREGWLLSLSDWRDEKAVVRWRTHTRHHLTQDRGRREILLDYHLRVGQLTRDTRLPQGQELREQRLDETEVGLGTAALLIDLQVAANGIGASPAKGVAAFLGLDADTSGLVEWDVFDAVMTPGQAIMLSTWKDAASASAFAEAAPLADDARLRLVRVIRDYGMFDRREAPQYFPDAPRITA